MKRNFISLEEIIETIQMVKKEKLDIRTITMGISLLDCCGRDPREVVEKVYKKVTVVAKDLVRVVREVEEEYGIPIVNSRISLTPLSLITANFSESELIELGKTLEVAANEVKVDFIGGFGALVEKGMTKWEERLISVIPEVLSSTEKVCSFVNVASTRAGINIDGVNLCAKVVKRSAELTATKDGIGAAKFVVFANAPSDNPFMAGAFHGIQEGESCINVGISGPGVIKAVVEDLKDVDFRTLANEIKKAAFKVTVAGELLGREIAKRLGIPFGIVDLSLAPTPNPGDSVAEIIEAMGIERCGLPGTTAALALLNDAVKKGGVMASSSVGGLSGAFIPVGEDAEMAHCASQGKISLGKLEAMTCVCSVGLDMIAIPGNTPEEIIACIIADEMAIGVINSKTTGVRLIPVPGKGVGEKAVWGGLLGEAPILPVEIGNVGLFIRRGGRIPPPLISFNN
ncbi:MAG: PFL family protein [Synergistetes bacterium]|nr:PFL family protein [Synergistota bacterium]MCX8127829.1 PFL family protein [Synergistota bacterium]MDW8192091.1 PFL family protein [Synergistota bacterium]